MRTETISFRDFMDRKTLQPTTTRKILSISPPLWVGGYVDHGLLFFGGMAAVFLLMIAAEHLGLELNESLVRMVLWTGLALFTGWAVLNTTFFRIF